MFFFFFNDTATTEIYTLSLHDALPILPSMATHRPSRTSKRTGASSAPRSEATRSQTTTPWLVPSSGGDRKSTRLNSSHANISYAVFCLKKKKQSNIHNASFTSPLHPDS